MITSQIIFSFIGRHCAGEINLKGDPHKLKKIEQQYFKSDGWASDMRHGRE